MADKPPRGFARRALDTISMPVKYYNNMLRTLYAKPQVQPSKPTHTPSECPVAAEASRSMQPFQIPRPDDAGMTENVITEMLDGLTAQGLIWLEEQIARERRLRYLRREWTFEQRVAEESPSRIAHMLKRFELNVVIALHMRVREEWRLREALFPVRVRDSSLEAQRDWVGEATDSSEED
ncbi:hypothetical protein PMZ80_010249 [Knufia obscura]|uniref:Uncharacterized protein n=2 Tax=Knufia TaxID=430999 RepID=A0AAN8IMA7_9EURO|nr:hypothetical protein PMZ80_010249 [Knufia obscura]KAK5952987.1 hypothetical protein OHC33_006108 [Knufia fluminis]